MSTTIDTTSEIRPFNVEISQEQIDNQRRRIEATRWPTTELVQDASQGIQLAFLQELARYWAEDYDFGRLEQRLNALPSVQDRDRRARHPLHPRQVREQGRPTADHYARLARLGDRDARLDRAAHRSRGPRR